jgi:Polyketide cyclase / dehydrase and lipid transport
MSTTGSASIEISRPPAEVWAAIADITRMGDWSPECIGGRWIGGASGPAVGATFEGDNELKIAGRMVKKWTTTSEVTACEPGAVFAFISEGYTTWRYEFAASATGTRVTESFSFEAKGFQGFLYNVVLQRPRSIVKGMRKTLERVKTVLTAG